MNRSPSPLRAARALLSDRSPVDPPSRRRGGLRRRPGLEPLEGRALLTAGLTEFPTPVQNPTALVTGTDGNLWVLGSDDSGDTVFTVVAPDGTVKATFTDTTPNAGTSALAVGPDGNIWFTETSANKIGKVTLAGVFTEYAIPNATGGDAPVDLNSPGAPAGVVASPTGIVAGPGGALWFTDSSSDAIGRITTDGTITQYPTPGMQPSSITLGPGGAIWFTDNSFNSFGGNTVNRLNLDGNGNVTFSTHHLIGYLMNPGGLTTGPDGDLRFIETYVDAFGRNNYAVGRIAASDAVTGRDAVSDQQIIGNFSSPGGLTFDAAGNLWIDGEGGLARITPQGLSLIVGLPNAADISTAGVTTGPDGAIWFTDSTDNRFGRIDPTTVTSLPTDNTLGIYTGPVVQATPHYDMSFTGTVASFLDGNPSASTSDFTAQIAWGDGSTSAGRVDGVEFGVWDVSGTHTYAQFGTYAATITITDVNPAHTPQPNTLTLTSSIDVSERPQIPPPGSNIGDDPISATAGWVGGGNLPLSGNKVGVPGVKIAGGNGTPVVVKKAPQAMPVEVKKAPAKAVVSSPSELAFFRAGFVKTWYMAAHQNDTTRAAVTPSRMHHVAPVPLPQVKRLPRMGHKAH